MKLDILAFGAHPDDVELGASGTLLVHINKGFKCGIVDLTRGELGTRGSADIRSIEAKRASEILGIAIRENLGLEDGFFQIDKKSQLAVVAVIRKYQPEIILCNAVEDRHPDHARAAMLVERAVFLAGLSRVQTGTSSGDQRWKTRAVYHYLQDRYMKPDVIVDVSDFWEKRMESVKAYSSQFYNPHSNEPDTAISGKDFLDFLTSRAIDMGRPIGVRYGEGFTLSRPPGTENLLDLL